MKVHDVVKLNPEIFPLDKRFTPEFQAGSLKYPVAMLMWDFRIVHEFVDSYHGEMVYATAFIPFGETGNVYLVKKDLIPSK